MSFTNKKPNIYRCAGFGGFWVCSGSGPLKGSGRTIHEAYFDWLNRDLALVKTESFEYFEREYNKLIDRVHNFH